MVFVGRSPINLIVWVARCLAVAVAPLVVVVFRPVVLPVRPWHRS